MSLLNEIISDFDDIVVKVNMTVYQGVTSRFKSSDQSRLSDEFLKYSFVVFQIKQLKYLFLKPFFSFIPNFCYDEQIHSFVIDIKRSYVLKSRWLSVSYFAIVVAKSTLNDFDFLLMQILVPH